MNKPAFPPDEIERLFALNALKVLDTPPEERFDRLVRLAQTLFNVPIALVSLIDTDRQWFKSCIGLSATEMGRNISFCGHAILSQDVFCVPNALKDPRFADNPLVTGPPDIRFYAGAPLTINGTYRIGTLCILDREPREFPPKQQALLRDLADIVQQQLELQFLYDVEKNFTVEKTRHQILFESIVDGIVIIDERGVINDVNPAAQRLFGYSKLEVMGKPISLLMTDASATLYKDYLLHYQVSNTANYANSEMQGKRKNETVFFMELVTSPMHLDDRLMFTAIIRDTSERKVMEQMKNEFVSTVSHELRTPLTSIHGALGLLLGKVADTIPPKMKMLLDTAYRNSERLSLLINDILDLEKIESGKLDFEFHLVDIVKLTQQAITANEGYADKHHVKLQLLASPDNALVFGDDHRLLQVFANLMSNAIKYSPTNGTVEIRIQPQETSWRIDVRDHGRGIPLAFKSQIFQRFAQADSSDTREKGGTGLGLSISKAIVERHQGVIGYESEEGQGTEFYFTLPMYQQETVVVEPTALKQPRLLICEDSPAVAHMLADLLKHEGLRADIAYSGSEAKNKLAQQNYDALLLDLTLPDMEGMDLLRELRQQPQFATLPIIVISGRASNESENWSGDSLAVIDWLQKPVDRKRLTEALQRALRHNDQHASILHVEDELDIIQITQMLVENIASYNYATSLAQAKQLLSNNHFDLILLDMSLPDGSGLELLPFISADSQVLVFSGQETSSTLSLQVAAALTKSKTSNDRLLATIKNLIAK
jgi:PAS domain S-box-containing protein